MVAFDDALTNGQANPCSRVLIGVVQAFEQSKDLLLKLRFNANAVVAHGEDQKSVLALSFNMHGGMALRAPVLDRIPDQILEQLAQVSAVNAQSGQFVAGDDCTTFRVRPTQIVERFRQSLVRVW